MMLTEFLLARIAEDEGAARAVLALRGSGTDYPLGHPLDPARVLADCEAKRQIVEEHPEMPVSKGVCSCMDHWPCATLRALAAIYADHPDYREAWKP